MTSLQSELSSVQSELAECQKEYNNYKVGVADVVLWAWLHQLLQVRAQSVLKHNKESPPMMIKLTNQIN